MTPIDEKIRGILRDAQIRSIEMIENEKYNDYKEWNKQDKAILDLALAEIKKVWGEMVGEYIDFAFNNPDKAPNNEEYVKGYNAANAELRQKVGE